MNELDTAATLLTPTVTDYCGTPKLNYPDIGPTVYCNWKSYGGTETVTDRQLTILDTAQITTWYDPRIEKGCRLRREDGKDYEILGKPEDINEQHIYMKFKVQRVEENVRGAVNG